MTCWHTLGKSICCYFVIRINYSIQDREMKVCHFTTRHCRQQVVSHRDVCEAPLWCCICASFPSMHTKMLSKQKRKNRFLQAHKCSALVLLHNACVVRRALTENHLSSSVNLCTPCTLNPRLCHKCVIYPNNQRTGDGKLQLAVSSLTTACFFISTRKWLRQIFIPILSYRFELSRH